jgi:hypothetical protein
VKVREPVARPLDVVGLELLLSASQAFLVGVLMYLAVGVWSDQAVGFGSVAAILALLGLAVGASWLYWLLGGVGWPMAAANVPAAMFFGFTLVLSWFGEDLFRVSGAPLLLAEIAAIYGIVCGVFLDSPRRWRWDQREKLRPGTKVPRVSVTAQALAAQMPRSLPRRSATPDDSSDLASRIEQSAPSTQAPSGDSATLGADGRSTDPDATDSSGGRDPKLVAPTDADAHLTDVPDVEGTPLEVPQAPEPTLPSARLEHIKERDTGGAAPDADDGVAEVELPTMVEPKAQRSPWAWAAPPEWNRDEDDDTAGSRTSKRS